MYSHPVKNFFETVSIPPNIFSPTFFSINLFDGILERSIQISKMNTIVQSWYKIGQSVFDKINIEALRIARLPQQLNSRKIKITRRRVIHNSENGYGKNSKRYSTSEKNFELHHCCGERAMSMPRIDVKNNTLKMRRRERRKEEPLKIDESRGRKKLSRRSTQNSRSSSEGSKTGARLEKRTGDERGAAREWNCARVKRPSARQPTYESGQLTPSNDTDVHRPDCV